MTLAEQKQLFQKISFTMEEILTNKGNDYANADRLSNFKLAAELCGISPEINCLSLISTKVARLGVLLNNDSIFNESVEDSIIDLANYSVLLYMIIKENEKKAIEQANKSIAHSKIF